MAKSSSAKAAPKSKKKATAQLPTLEEAVKLRPDADVPLISAKKLKALLNADNNSKGEIDTVIGELREGIKYAADYDHLHKGAYADLKRWDRLAKDPEKFADRWRTMLVYMEMRGLFQVIDTVLRLDLQSPAEEQTPAKETKATTPKTKAKPGPAFGSIVAKLAAEAGASPPSSGE